MMMTPTGAKNEAKLKEIMTEKNDEGDDFFTDIIRSLAKLTPMAPDPYQTDLDENEELLNTNNQ